MRNREELKMTDAGVVMEQRLSLCTRCFEWGAHVCFRTADELTWECVGNLHSPREEMLVLVVDTNNRLYNEPTSRGQAFLFNLNSSLLFVIPRAVYCCPMFN